MIEVIVFYLFLTALALCSIFGAFLGSETFPKHREKIHWTTFLALYI